MERHLHSRPQFSVIRGKHHLLNHAIPKWCLHWHWAGHKSLPSIAGMLNPSAVSPQLNGLLKGKETIALHCLGQMSLVSWVKKIGCAAVPAPFALHKVKIEAKRCLFHANLSTLPTMDEEFFECEHCGRSNFRSQSGLTKHQLNPNKGGCFGKIGASCGATANFKTAAACLPCDAVFNPRSRKSAAKMRFNMPKW